MTIQEAIKANETRRVKRVGTDNWYYPKSMVISDFFTIEDIQSDWEAEPEKIEFECEWELDAGVVVPFVDGERDFDILEKLLGKRTRVTVEVIDE